MFQTLGDPVLEHAVIEAASFVTDLIGGSFMAKLAGTHDSIEYKDVPPRWLSFVGISGTGKTFLARQVYEIAKGFPWPTKPRHGQGALINPVRSVFWPKLLSRLRNKEFWMIDELAECSFVFLDEIAVEHDPSGFAKDKLCELLSRRVRSWTVLTSNLTLEKLAVLDTRIPSRMIRDGSVAVEMNTQDFALR